MSIDRNVLVLAQHAETEANPRWHIAEFSPWPGSTSLLVQIGYEGVEFDLADAADRIQLHHIVDAIGGALTRTQPEFVSKVRADAIELARGGAR